MKLMITGFLFTFTIIYITFYLYGHHKYLCKSNYDYPFQDPTLPTDVRLDNLMSLLTTEEKVIILSRMTNVTKFLFQIDMLWMSEATSGMIRQTLVCTLTTISYFL